ncbi:hypothetical protein [Nakamurella deserti]|uniref:hypothetical protein n=1 Tax=Nakamurella deserti TaxID=2164074 RepID=UPI000DBE1F84|nr:hypothetical protein [Nakamurella deserti]
MTAVDTSGSATAGPGAEAPTFNRLLATEWRRLSARRFTRVLLLVSAVGYLVAMAFIWSQHAQPTEADYAQATVARDQQVVEIQRSVDACLAAGESSDTCGVAPTVDSFPLDYFLDARPFTPEQVPGLTSAVGIAVAMAAFVLASTVIGAEWSSRNIVAWLFFEPRRLRLLGAKLLTLLGLVVVLAFVAQAIWLSSARLLMSQRGLPVSSLGSSADAFWPTTLQVSVRAALLVVPMAVLGFGLANLMRNTAAALGVAFVYFAVVETVLGGISPRLQPYQFTVGLRAWVQDGGITVYGDPVYDQQTGNLDPELIPVSNLHGGIVLLAYAVVVLTVSVALFRRRDIT